MGTVATAPAAFADTGGYPYANAVACGNDYDWCIGGREFSPYGDVYRNCTDYAAWWLETHGVADTNVRGLGDASTWATYAPAHRDTVDSTPTVGSVAQWVSIDHVAIVTAVNADGTVNIAEYNYAGDDGGASGEYGTRTNVRADHYIHFPAINPGSGSPPPPPPPVKSDFNGDGRSDIAWYQGTTIFDLQSLGNGTFGTAGTTDGIGTPTWAGVGDFNGDGKDDLAWYQGTTIFDLNSHGDGTFGIAGHTDGIGTPTWAGAGSPVNSNGALLPSPSPTPSPPAPTPTPTRSSAPTPAPTPAATSPDTTPAAGQANGGVNSTVWVCPGVTRNESPAAARKALQKLKARIGNTLEPRGYPKVSKGHRFVVSGFLLQTSSRVKEHGKRVTVFHYRSLHAPQTIPKGGTVAVQLKLVRT